MLNSNEPQINFLVTTVQKVSVPALSVSDEYEYIQRIDILNQADKLGITDDAMQFLSNDKLTISELGAYRSALWHVVLFSPCYSSQSNQAA